MLAAYGSAFAETNASVEEQLAQIVQSALDLEELAYEYDAENQSFSIPFSLGCALGQSDVTIYLYDDMISVAADCPLQFDSKSFEKVAVFTTLATMNCITHSFVWTGNTAGSPATPAMSLKASSQPKRKS